MTKFRVSFTALPAHHTVRHRRSRARMDSNAPLLPVGVRVAVARHEYGAAPPHVQKPTPSLRVRLHALIIPIFALMGAAACAAVYATTPHAATFTTASVHGSGALRGDADGSGGVVHSTKITFVLHTACIPQGAQDNSFATFDYSVPVVRAYIARHNYGSDRYFEIADAVELTLRANSSEPGVFEVTTAMIDWEFGFVIVNNDPARSMLYELGERKQNPLVRVDADTSRCTVARGEWGQRRLVVSLNSVRNIAMEDAIYPGSDQIVRHHEYVFGSCETSCKPPEKALEVVRTKYEFLDRAALKSAVDACIKEMPSGVGCHVTCGGHACGEIGTWDVSRVTDMSELFKSATDFNADTSGWNTSAVTDMKYMFASAQAFNGNISGWNTAAVTDMTAMLSGAVAFNGDTSGWNTAAVTTIQYMFATAQAFNGDIGSWNTSAVTNMKGLFSGAGIFNRDISSWNTARVTTMRDMFNGATAFNANISGWKTARVTDMAGMFFSAKAFNANISGWNTARVTDTQFMFMGATVFNANTTSKVPASKNA